MLPILMTGRILLIVAALAFSQTALAQTGSDSRPGPPERPPPGMLLTSTEAEDAIIAGRVDMMASRMDAAEATFLRLLLEPGNDEAARYHLVALAFTRAMFEQSEPVYAAFFEQSDDLEDLLEDVSEDGEPSAWLHFFDAENYLMRAFVHARKGDFLRTAVSAHEAYEVYLDALRADPTLIDVETGIGLLKAMIGATPPAYKRFLKMFGYTGTIDEALKLLDHAAKKARYNGAQAALFASLTRVFMNRGRGEATERLAVDYGAEQNPFTGLMYAFALRYSRKPAKAVEVARESIRIGERSDYTQVPFLYFHLGSALFSLNRFEEAAPELVNYVRLFSGQSYRATAQVRLGLSLEMLGRRPEAERVYRQIDTETEFDLDLAANRAADDLLANPLSEDRKALLRGRNAVSGGRTDEAITSLEPLFFRPKTADDDRIEAAYWLGRAYHLGGDFEEAASKYAWVRTHPADKKLRWVPWSTYYLGLIREKENRLDEAEKLFREALKHKGDYDFRKSLRLNARLAIDRL